MASGSSPTYGSPNELSGRILAQHKALFSEKSDKNKKDGLS
jgi:hypothetical protein